MEFTDDILETVVNRKAALAVLAEEPHHRQELQEKLDYSKATCHRIIRSFDERGLIRRTNNGYELSELGRTLNTQVRQFEESVRTAWQIESLLEGIAASDVEFDIELVMDANIVRAEANDPYPPIKRFLELFRESDTVRNFGPTPIPPTMVDEFFELQFSEGKKIEIIKPSPVLSKYVSEYEEYGRKAAERNQLGCRIHHNLPFGMSLFENHIGLRGYDLETGTVLVSVDTNDPEAVAWGERVFEHYREQSSPLAEYDDFPKWAQDGLTLTID
jgi:predicted transcriptional regulator